MQNGLNNFTVAMRLTTYDAECALVCTENEKSVTSPGAGHHIEPTFPALAVAAQNRLKDTSKMYHCTALTTAVKLL